MTSPTALPDRFSVVPSPVGDLVLTGTTEVLSGCWFTGAGTVDRTAGLVRDDSAFVAASQQLEEYFAGRRRDFVLPLAPLGTEFQRRVWSALRTIPYGATWSYRELALAVGSPNASRAVGLANGRNPHSIIVPCHRVIGADGRLTGYGGGLDRKRLLLDLEAGVAPLV